VKNPDLSVRIGRLTLKNPLILASGTHSFAEAYNSLARLDACGAVILKTVTVKPRLGNIPPRTCETAAGMINAIGLQNEGLDGFLKHKESLLRSCKTTVIVSIYAETLQELLMLVRRFDELPRVKAMELNLSCPNVRLKKDSFVSQDKAMLARYVASARKATLKPLIAKLTPHVVDIKEMAKTAEGAGADAITLANTFKAMAIDIETLVPKLGNVVGGLSGPAIKPLALALVWEASSCVRIPVIGVGGIMNANDAIEFLAAGAAALQVGTLGFVFPREVAAIPHDIQRYLAAKKLKNIAALRERFTLSLRKRY